MITFNVLNEEHYVSHCRALHKMKAEDRFAMQLRFFQSLLQYHPDLGFLCLQEVNVVDMMPVLHFFLTKGFDFVFSGGREVTYDSIVAMLKTNPSLAQSLFHDLMVIIFDAKRFKMTGAPTVKSFGIPSGNNYAGTRGGSSSSSSSSTSTSFTIAKAVLSQLFEDETTHQLFKIITVHAPFEADDAGKKERIRFILDDFPLPAPGSSGPGANFILCGDLNIDDRRDGNIISSGFYGWREATAGIRATSMAPSGNAVQKVDYIFTRGAARLDLSKGRTEKEACFVDPDNEQVWLKHQGNDPLYQNSFCSDHACVIAKIEIG